MISTPMSIHSGTVVSFSGTVYIVISNIGSGPMYGEIKKSIHVQSKMHKGVLNGSIYAYIHLLRYPRLFTVQGGDCISQ